MNGPADLGRGWLAKAESDLSAARRILGGPGPYDTACFHAQQAIEKCLKAVLSCEGARIPRTHDLGDLAELVQAVRPDIELDAEGLSEITPFAVELRYDAEFWPDRDVAAGAVSTAQELRDRSGEALFPEGPEGGSPGDSC